MLIEERKMHYFPFHIGDYRAATAHLSNEEDLAYHRLLHVYYDTELPIPLDLEPLARRLRVPRAAIETVLADFFILTEAGWTNSRADTEIAKYQSFTVSGKKGAETRWSKIKDREPIGSLLAANGGAIGSLPNPNSNQEPVTKNQQPITKNQDKPKVKPAGAEAPAWLPASWQIYTQHRKESRKPLTATAQTAAINKLERWKAEGKDISAIITQSVENGWSGLFEVKQGVGQGKPSFTPPKLSCCVCGGVLKGFVETQSGKMCGTCWDKR
jgi:uncharacterized protein YdaU (DUF1376 family)